MVLPKIGSTTDENPEGTSYTEILAQTELGIEAASHLNRPYMLKWMKGTALLSGAKILTARAVSAYTQCTWFLHLQMGGGIN